MTEKTTLRDFTGKIIGTISTDTVSGDQTIRDFYGRILGTYNKRLNITKDFYGRIVARGNALQMLLNTKK